MAAGEALDVIAAALAGVDPLEPWVSDWGADPVWASGALPADQPLPGHFYRDGIEIGENLTLRELNDDD